MPVANIPEAREPLSEPPSAGKWVAPLGFALSHMSCSGPSVTHRSAFGFWLVLKGCPGQAEQTQSLWFSLFLNSSPVKWECGKKMSLCKLLVHNCCWVLYLSTHPSACHHAAATTLYLSCSFSFFLNLWVFSPHSLPCCWFLLLFSLPLALSFSLYFFFPACTFVHHLHLTRLVARAAHSLRTSQGRSRHLQEGNKPWPGTKMNFTPVIRAQ